MCGCRDEVLLELNGKTYMLSLKVYETVKTDVAAAICNALIYSAAEMLDPSARGWNG